MTIQIWFWLFMAVWLIFGFWRNNAPAAPYLWVGGIAIELVLFIILGWQVFGSPVK